MVKKILYFKYTHLVNETLFILSLSKNFQYRYSHLFMHIQLLSIFKSTHINSLSYNFNYIQFISKVKLFQKKLLDKRHPKKRKLLKKFKYDVHHIKILLEVENGGMQQSQNLIVTWKGEKWGVRYMNIFISRRKYNNLVWKLEWQLLKYNTHF